MSNRSITVGLVLSLTLISSSQMAFGWGEPGHELINRAAAQLMKSSAAAFFQANDDSLALFATTPDLKWKAPATYPQEKGLHFFQVDNYNKSPLAGLFPIGLNAAIQAVGQDFIDVNGSNVWRSSQIYKKMVDAFQSNDCAKALQMAGVLGHYIGDLSQPMHNTSDYDGQSIGEHGIHAYFETKLVKKQNQDSLLTKVVKAGAQPHPEVEPSHLTGDEKDVIAITNLEGQAAYLELPALLADFEADPQNDADLVKHFAPLMGRGAYTLARVWDLAAQRASSKRAITCGDQEITVTEPAWFALSE